MVQVLSQNEDLFGVVFTFTGWNFLVGFWPTEKCCHLQEKWMCFLSFVPDDAGIRHVEAT